RDLQHARDRLEYGERLLRGQLLARVQLGAKRPPLDVLEHEVCDPFLGYAQVVDLDRVRVAEAARRLSLAQKTPQPGSAGANIAREQFERDDVLEQDVAGAIDGTHPSLPKQRLDLVEAVEGGAEERGRVHLERLAVVGAQA